MKKILIVLLIIPCMAFADAPATSCPNGYVSITESAMSIATTCPNGTVSAGVAESCLVENSAGTCIMYAPVAVSYTDASGTYEFTEPCAM